MYAWPLHSPSQEKLDELTKELEQENDFLSEANAKLTELTTARHSKKKSKQISRRSAAEVCLSLGDISAGQPHHHITEVNQSVETSAFHLLGNN